MITSPDKTHCSGVPVPVPVLPLRAGQQRGMVGLLGLFLAKTVFVIIVYLFCSTEFVQYVDVFVTYKTYYKNASGIIFKYFGMGKYY